MGWGGAITFTYLRTPMMLRHGTFTCTCAHTSCYVEDVSRHAGVGWGGVITFTYLRTPMMLRHGTFTCTCAHTSCYVEDVSRHAGVGWVEVGWGNNVHVLAHSHRKIQFIKKIRRHAGKTFWVHTGTIDSCWRMIKASVPDQLTSCPENEQKLKDLI